MADDKSKKPKIDLKARLGRTTAMGMTAPASLPGPPPSSNPGGGFVPAPPGSEPGPTHGSSAPPASRPSTVPSVSNSVRPPPGISHGIAPPPGLSPGIPLPPFAQQPRAAPRAEPKPSAAQQTIKVEIGEEIHEERKKARNRAGLAALAGVAIGLGIGWTAGGSARDGDRAKTAARGAAALEKDVKDANAKLVDLDAKLTEAAKKLNDKAFPDDLSTALAGLTIPFDTTNLDNKGVAGMPNKLFKSVLAYTQACVSLNELRESLKNASFAAKDPFTKAFKEETAPVANYSVTFRSDSGKVVADLVQNKDTFLWKADFPPKYKIAARPTDKDVTRFVKGDLFGGSDTIAIPIDPKSTAALVNDPAVGRFYKAMGDMKILLQGRKDNPTTETNGLLKDGEDLVNELHKAAQFQ